MSTVAVDPRIRERRVTVARDAGRRRLRRVLVVGLVGVVAVLGVGLTWTPVLDVEAVEVQGAVRTPAAAVLDAAGVARGDALVWFDQGAAQDAIAALPWVDHARVTRSWSGTVRIEVTERRPVAALVDRDGSWLLADAGGRVVATADTAPADLTVVDGVTASAAPGDQLDAEVLEALTVAGAVPAVLRPEVATVQGSGSALELTLRAGGTVVLGGAEEAVAKLAAAAAVLAAVTPGCVERLDVTLPAAPALVRVPGCV